ncbi:DUF6216 family protein [Paraburkholderia sp. BR14320]|uniref:DUF6216 family protein n=1 Tax=unclassified Paraburkholderia TaxID=2615204 RepID=UPI0034CE5F57
MGSLSEFVQSPIFTRLPYVAAVAVAGAFLGSFYWWRAGSIHSILERIWYLIAGKTDVHDPALRSFFQKNRELEKFRFLYGVKVDTSVDMQQLLNWMDKHNVGMLTLRKVRSWVDASTEEIIRQPPKYHSRIRIFFATVAFTAFFLATQFGSSHAAYFKMKASGVWFATDTTTVRALWDGWWFGDGWSFDLSDCADESKIVRVTKFNETETQSICKSLKDGQLRSLTKETVKLQMWFGAISALVALVIVIPNVWSAFAAINAENIRRKLYSQTAEISKGTTEVVKLKRSRSPRKKASDVQPEQGMEQATGKKEDEPEVLTDGQI